MTPVGRAAPYSAALASGCDEDGPSLNLKNVAISDFPLDIFVANCDTLLMFEITYSRQAIKGMMRLQPARRQAIIDAINAVAADPFGKHPNVRRLAASQAYRLRAGDWRVIYELDRKTETMHVVIIAPRGRAYR